MADASRTRTAHVDVGEFRGPDDLADAVLRVRAEHPEERRHFGAVADRDVRRLVRIAYYTSQTTNEGRHPRLTLFVPAPDSRPNVLLETRAEFTTDALRRLGPTLPDRGVQLVLSADSGHLWVTGYAASPGLLTDLGMGDPDAPSAATPRGLQVEVVGPGDLRVAEHRVHRLHAGSLRLEASLHDAVWHQTWLNRAALARFGWSPGGLPPAGRWPVVPTRAIDAVWLRLLREAAALRHGACFVILPGAAPPSLRPTFPVGGCDLGRVLVEVCEQVAGEDRTPADPVGVRERQTLRQRLPAVIEAVARLSATDGCVVFDRGLRLTSFGSMIGGTAGEQPDAPCHDGDTGRALTEDDLRSFGARRRSAIQVCADCPGAVVFVVSQDGDLRAFVSGDDGVHFYDHLAYW